MSMFVCHRQTRAWHRRWYRGCIFMSSGHDGHRISCLSPLWSADNITRQVRNTQITHHKHTKNTQNHNSSQEHKYGPLVWLKCVWINATLKNTKKHWASRYPQVTQVSPLFLAHAFFSRMTWNHFELLGMFLAVQDSSIGDLVTDSLTHSVTQTFDFNDNNFWETFEGLLRDIWVALQWHYRAEQSRAEQSIA